MAFKFFNHRTLYSILFYVLVIVLIIVAKPSFLFDENNQIKQFGVGSENKTIISMGTIVFFLAIVSYYIFLTIDIVFNTAGSAMVSVKNANVNVNADTDIKPRVAINNNSNSGFRVVNPSSARGSPVPRNQKFQKAQRTYVV